MYIEKNMYIFSLNLNVTFDYLDSARKTSPWTSYCSEKDWSVSQTRLFKILIPFLRLHFTSFVLAIFTHGSSAQSIVYSRMWELTVVLLHCTTLTITHSLKKDKIFNYKSLSLVCLVTVLCTYFSSSWSELHYLWRALRLSRWELNWSSYTSAL